MIAGPQSLPAETTTKAAERTKTSTESIAVAPIVGASSVTKSIHSRSESMISRGVDEAVRGPEITRGIKIVIPKAIGWCVTPINGNSHSIGVDPVSGITEPIADGNPDLGIGFSANESDQDACEDETCEVTHVAIPPVFPWVKLIEAMFFRTKISSWNAIFHEILFRIAKIFIFVVGFLFVA
jgi:hypothetical protein